MMKKIIFSFRSALVFFLLAVSSTLSAQKQVYEIRIYRLQSDAQVTATDAFLQQAYLPALHRLGLKQIGVFKPFANDTAQVKMICVVVPFASLDSWHSSQTRLRKDQNFVNAGESFVHADTAHIPYSRLSTTLVEAFSGHPLLTSPGIPVTDSTIYELRSYESPTEHLYERKVTMFNEGGEIPLFQRLGFNAIFYGDVISGNKMPNLMYMTVFSGDSSHSEHWRAFVKDSVWKKISTSPLYENNISVSHADIMLMRRAAYSDL